MKSKNTLFENDTAIVGVIGMDILSQKHCYFDMKNQTITFSDDKKNQTDSPYLVLSYKLSNKPLIDLSINGSVFEDILFDTGFNSFMQLFEEERKKLNVQILPLKEDTCYDFFNNKYIVNFEEHDSLKINDVTFSKPFVYYGKRLRLLGIVFVKCWSSFSIDPFKKEIEFYL